MPYKWKKTSSSVKQCADSSGCSSGEKQQRGKEQNAARQSPWGSAGCTGSRDGAGDVTGQEHCCPVQYTSPSQNLSQFLQEK